MPDIRDLPAQKRDYSYLYSFPFWINTDTTRMPEIVEVEVEGGLLRVYPPFRSANDSFTWTPNIDIGLVPTPRGKGLTGVRASKFFGVSGAAITMEDADTEALFDSLRIDAYGKANANSFMEALIVRLRWFTKQWWIGRSVSPMMGYLRSQFEIDQEGRPTGLVLNAISVAGQWDWEQPLTDDIWTQAMSSVVRDDPIPHYDLLLLDAHYMHSIGDKVMFVLNAAGACEGVKDAAFETGWRRRNPGVEFQKRKELRGSNLLNQMKHDFVRVTGRDFALEEPEAQRGIEDLWSARMRVAHGRPPAFERDGTTRAIDENAMFSMLDGAMKFVEWLELTRAEGVAEVQPPAFTS